MEKNSNILEFLHVDAKERMENVIKEYDTNKVFDWEMLYVLRRAGPGRTTGQD